MINFLNERRKKYYFIKHTFNEIKEKVAAKYLKKYFILRFKQFLAGREFEADFVTTARFYPELLKIFRAVAPLVRFLNRPLLQSREPRARWA